MYIPKGQGRKKLTEGTEEPRVLESQSQPWAANVLSENVDMNTGTRQWVFSTGCRSGGKGTPGPEGPGTRAAVNITASRGRLETAELVPGGLTSAPRSLGLPLWTRRQSRSARRCSATAPARLGLGLQLPWRRLPSSGSPGPRRRRPSHGPGSGSGPGAHLPVLRSGDRDSLR